MVQEEKSFKGISCLERWRPFCSAELNLLCNFDRRHHEEQFCVIILNLDRWVRKRCHLKLFLIWRFGGPFYSGVEPFCNFGRGIMQEEQFYSVKYFEFGPVVQEEMSFKIFLIWSSGGPCVRWSSVIYAILVEGIIGNLHVK